MICLVQLLDIDILTFNYKVLADPAAPSMGSSSVITTNDADDNRNNSLNIQSPVSHDNSYPPSPSTSTGYALHNNSLPMSARSVPDQQIPVSPKPVMSQQVPQQRQYQSTPQSPSPQQQQHHNTVPKQVKSPSSYKQNSIPKPAVANQHRKYCKATLVSFLS